VSFSGRIAREPTLNRSKTDAIAASKEKPDGLAVKNGVGVPVDMPAVPVDMPAELKADDDELLAAK